MSRGLFVTGTDTGAGKTVVACAVVRGLRARGLDVGVMKPIETGVDPHTGPLDASALRAAAGDSDPLDRVCPLQFALPAAPNVAAAAEDRCVDLARVHEVYEDLALQHDWMVVEGAGGLLVPTTDDATMADLARDLDLPLLVVARAALGTINHTRLTLEEVTRQGIDLVGVAISHDHVISDADAANLDCLRQWLGERLLFEVPTQDDPTAATELEAPSTARLLERLEALGSRSGDS